MTRPLFAALLLTVSAPAWAQDPTPTPAGDEVTDDGSATTVEGEGEEELPEQVRALREKVLESRARLLMLPEEIHGSLPTQAGLRLRVANELPGDFKLEKVEARLNGVAVVDKALTEGDDSSLLKYEQPLAPGAHTLDLTLTYRGNGRGLFPYMRAYEVVIEGSYPFVVPDQVVAAVTATVSSDNPLKKHWKQRPELRFALEEDTMLPRMTGAPPQPPTQDPETPQ